MYILRVIPLKRRIPGGELTYISKNNVSVGSILEVPIKKSIELVIVVKQNSVEKEKEYIKSINFKITTLNNSKPVAILNKKVLSTIIDFCTYSICDLDRVVRALFSKVDFTKNFETKDVLIITTKENKNKPNSVSFHKSLSFFCKNKILIKELVIDNPKSLTLYGQNYLGFDPTLFYILLARNLEMSISFNISEPILIYSEWGFNKNKNTREADQNNVNIYTRDPEDKQDKLSPLSNKIIDLLNKNILEKNRVLIISNSRNYALKTICHDCSTLHNCLKCNKTLVLVKNNRNYAKKYGVAGEYIYVCSNCLLAENSIAKCRNCDSWNLVPLGYGTERLIEQLKNLLSKQDFANVYDMTERIKAKNLKDWVLDGGIIVTKPNFIFEIDKADVVFMPSISPILYNKSFSSLESARNMLEELKSISKEIYLNVMNKNEKDILSEDYKTWHKNETIDRKTFYYPPYGRLLKIELDIYASNSPAMVEAIWIELNKIAIHNTVNKDKNQYGNVIIEASFSNESWSIINNNYDTPEKIRAILYPFLKHLKIEVY
jgi:primosomal protein N'